MTREEILAMKPGRELDVLVAHEIFDIDVEWDYPFFDIDKQLPKLPFKKGEPRTRLGHLAHAAQNTINFYSTDFSAAWPVVEKLCNWDNRDAMLTLKGQGKNPTPLEDNNGEWWEATIDDDSGKEWQAEGKTAPEAICKAALITKIQHQESEVKDEDKC